MKIESQIEFNVYYAVEIEIVQLRILQFCKVSENKDWKWKDFRSENENKICKE